MTFSQKLSHAYGHHIHLWSKIICAVLVTGDGWMIGQMMETMVAYTMFLTITTDLGTIVIVNAGEVETEAREKDTRDIKDEVKEIARAVPGAKDVTRD